MEQGGGMSHPYLVGLLVRVRGRRQRQSGGGRRWKWPEAEHCREVQFSSVAQSCPTLCDPMNYSTLGLPVHHQLLEFTQTHVH